MEFEFKNVLVTGAAGFIGFHLCRRLLKEKIQITGLDNLSPYYDVRLKKDRLDRILSASNFKFIEMDLADRTGMQTLFKNNRFHSFLILRFDNLFCVMFNGQPQKIFRP